MKKIVLAAGLLAMSLSLPVHAEESKAGGLEFSGNVDVVTGWQHDDGASFSPTLAVPGGFVSFPGTGLLGDFRGANAPHRDRPSSGSWSSASWRRSPPPAAAAAAARIAISFTTPTSASIPASTGRCGTSSTSNAREPASPAWRRRS